jgi:hypothetical protein
MGVRVRDGEKTSDWVPTEEPIDLGVLGFTPLVDEYDELEARIKRDVARRDEIKEVMKLLGSNRVLLVNGKEQFQLRKDGQFMPKEFGKDHPTIWADFIELERKPVFNLDKFKSEMPALYAQYRASKIVRVTGK